MPIAPFVVPPKRRELALFVYRPARRNGIVVAGGSFSRKSRMKRHKVGLLEKNCVRRAGDNGKLRPRDGPIELDVHSGRESLEAAQKPHAAHKAVQAHGSGEAHEMLLAFRETGLIQGRSLVRLQPAPPKCRVSGDARRSGIT